MLPKHRVLLLILLFIAASGGAMAQKGPQALLHVNNTPGRPDREAFYVEVKLHAPLCDRLYRLLMGTKTPSADPPATRCDKTYEMLKDEAHPSIGGLASSDTDGFKIEGTGNFTNVLVVSPDDRGTRTRFRIYIPSVLAPLTGFDDKGYSVVLGGYVSDSDKRLAGAITVTRALSRDFSTAFVTCRPEQLSAQVKYDSKHFNPNGTPADSEGRRILAIYDYLDAVRQDTSKLAQLKIQVEPQTGDKVADLRVKGLTLNPERAALPNNALLSVCFDTSKGVPTEKYDAKLFWGPGAPPEIVEPMVITNLDGRTGEASPSVFLAKEAGVGERPIEKDLNVAVSLLSSVEDKEQPDKTIRRERNTRATLDLRVGFLRDFRQLKPLNIGKPQICRIVAEYTPAQPDKPGSIKFDNGVSFNIAPGENLPGVVRGTEQCLGWQELPDPATGQIRSPTITSAGGDVRTAGLYNVLTPFYIDAKVSTGKIEKDTLSLNRVVFGISEELRYVPKIGGFPTYYRFIFQGNHSSDRDFKQREFTGRFEFRPVISALNHPYDPSNTVSRQKVLCVDCKKNFKLVPIRYGYEFVPLIGAEIGRTYYRHRPAEAIEPSDTVRRFFVGLNASVHPTPRLAFTAAELFYIRGESKTDRYHNYFLGEASFRLGTFFGTRGAHSVFLSWERGGQPPFDDPDVNVLKLGYRVSATTLFGPLFTRFDR
jgi:hypothetical protein